ncbi:MAG: flagellar export protein FliJ [Desulfobacterales bacterium]
MYRFKLQSLLKHRCHQEEICQKEMAEATRVLTDAQEKLRHQKKEKHENLQKLHSRQKERHNISDILIFINYIQQLSRDMEAQMQQVGKASANVTQKRHNLTESMKKRKTLEKLKEKDWLEYQQKMMQTERKFNDEVAATRHIRKM